MELELSKWLFLSPIQHFWGVILYRKQVIISYVISCTFICARQGYQIWQPNWVKWDKSATFSDQIQEELRIQIFICIQVSAFEFLVAAGSNLNPFGSNTNGLSPELGKHTEVGQHLSIEQLFQVYVQNLVANLCQFQPTQTSRMMAPISSVGYCHLLMSLNSVT